MAAATRSAEVRIALVADSVFLQAGAKWCVIGVFSAINAKAFPALHPGIGLFLRVVCDPGDYRLRLSIVHEDSSVVADVTHLTLKMPSEVKPIDIGVQLQMLPLPKPGRYDVRLSLDDTEVPTGLSFMVNAVTSDLNVITGGQLGRAEGASE